jgi:hypothetical protein
MEKEAGETERGGMNETKGRKYKSEEKRVVRQRLALFICSLFLEQAGSNIEME